MRRPVVFSLGRFRSDSSNKLKQRAAAKQVSIPNRAAFQTGGRGIEKKLQKKACIVFPTEIVGDQNHSISVDINDRMKDETRKP